MAEAPGPDGLEHFNAESSTPLWRRRIKGSEAGRVAAALYRRRRLPTLIVGAGLRTPAVPAPSPASRRKVRAVVWVPAGPGAVDDVLASWESAVASSPGAGEVALLVTDDWMPKADVARLRSALPDAVIVRTRVPSGGPPRLWPVTALAIGTALAHFDFEYLVKFDTDALATGPGWVAGLDAAITKAQREAPVAPAVERKQQLAGAGVESGDRASRRSAVADGSSGDVIPGSEVPIGIAGAFVDRPDGDVEIDAPYHRRVLEGELPRDATVAGWHRRALAGGWPHGEIVQGGCLVLSHACCAAIATEGALTYRPRLRTIVSEDLLLTVLAYALGFRAASIGGAGGPLAVANKHLPVPLTDVVDPASRWLVAHSVRLGLGGEPEAEIRAAAVAARDRW